MAQHSILQETQSSGNLNVIIYSESVISSFYNSQVLLVEDSKASTSACSLEIEVGNFLDPPHLQGKSNIQKKIFSNHSLWCQVLLTYWSTQYFMPQNYFLWRASDISWVSEEAATMPSLPRHTPTFTLTFPRNTF